MKMEKLDLPSSEIDGFKENLINLMSEERMSVRYLANHIGVSEVTVHHWRQGRRFPSAKNAFQLAKTFNRSVDEIFVKEI